MLELESRFNIAVEKYIKEVNIEAAVMVQIAKQQIFPAAVSYAGDLSQSLMKSREFLGDLETQEEEELVSRIHRHISELLKFTKTLKKERTALLESEEEDFIKAMGYKNNILPLMAILRNAADILETLVGRDYWPLPTYEEMLFKL